MARRRLTAEWSIDVDEAFRQRVVDGNLQMVWPGPPVRTIWLAIWNADAATADELVAESHSSGPADALRFEEPGADEEERRVGAWYREPTEDGGVQWGLYGYTIRPTSYVQAAFISDAKDDLDWALETWRSLRATRD